MTLKNERKIMCAVNFAFHSIAYSLSNICTGRINKITPGGKDRGEMKEITKILLKGKAILDLHKTLLSISGILGLFCSFQNKNQNIYRMRTYNRNVLYVLSN